MLKVITVGKILQSEEMKNIINKGSYKEKGIEVENMCELFCSDKFQDKLYTILEKMVNDDLDLFILIIDSFKDLGFLFKETGLNTNESLCLLNLIEYTVIKISNDNAGSPYVKIAFDASKNKEDRMASFDFSLRRRV